MKALALSLLVVACTEEVAIEPGVCGNFVLETGEECDRPGGACTADCRAACSFGAGTTCEVVDGAAVLDGTCCPTGFGCGADGACRSPSGRFTNPGGVVPFVVPFFSEFRIGDLDGDGVADALGVSSGSVIARYGGAAPFGTGIQNSAAFANGTVAIGDYSKDGRNDVLIPTNGGVSVFESGTGVPTPVAVPIALRQQHVDLRVTATPVLVRLGATPGGLELDVDVEGTQAASRPPCGGNFSDSEVAGHALHPFADLSTGRLAVPIGIARSRAQICIEFFEQGLVIPPVFATLTDTSFSYQLVPGGEVLFADVDPVTPCPELVIPVYRFTPDLTTFIDTVNLVLAGTGTPGDCSVSTDTSTARTIGAGEDGLRVVLGTVQVQDPPQPPDPGNDPSLPLPTPRGLLLTQNGIVDLDRAGSLITFTRPWSQISTADFNNDGLADFAAISAGGNSVQDDIEVFEQVPAVGEVRWRVQRIPTSGLLVDLATGDFDGDGLDDVAFATQDFNTDETRVLVAFRDGTQFSGPVAVTTLFGFHQLARGSMTDPAFQSSLDQYDDLVVIHGGYAFDGVDASDTARLTLLFGGANRQLSAPWLPPPVQPGDPRVRTARASVIGPFGADATPGVLAVFDSPEPQPGCSVERTLVRAQIPDGGTIDTLDRLPDIGDVKVCQIQADSTEVFPTLDSSVLVVVPDVGGDMVLAFSQFGFPAGLCGAVYRIGSDAMTALPCDDMFEPALREVFLDPANPARALRVQLIGDHRLLLIAARSDRELVYELTLDASASRFRFTEVIDVGARVEAMFPDLVCEDGTVAELGTRLDADGGLVGEGKEVVLSCRDSGFALHLVARYANSSDTTEVVEDLGTLPAYFYADIEAGDVNGDGLDDIAATVLAGTLHVLLQCDGRSVVAGTCL